MKKLLLILILCFSYSLTACKNNTTNFEKNESLTETDNFETLVNNISEESDAQLKNFDKTATIDETILVDEDGVKITATSLNYTNFSVELQLIIENNSEKNLSFVSGSIGYSCNSINGYMFKNGYLNCDVAAGKKANESISFSYDELILYGINKIADIEIGFDISDDDYNHIYSGPRQVKTSASDTYDYTKDYYQDTITNRTTMNTYNYDILHFSQDEIYNVNGVKLLSSGIMINKESEPILLLEFENTTNEIIYLSTSDIAINDLIVYSSNWSSDAINPGKRGIIDLELSSILDLEYWDIYGINEIASVTLSINQRNSEGTFVAEETSIKVTVPNVKSSYDSTGSEIYNKNGLRILTKQIVDNSSDYNSDIYVFLLAENKTGKKLTIEDIYNSLSVNGFMTNYSFYGKTIPNQTSAILKINLMSSSLKDNQINSISDIKDIQIEFEIKENQNTIDTANIEIILN